MRLPTDAELIDAILHLRAAALLADCLGPNWFRRGDPRPLLPLTYAAFAAAALQQGIPTSILREDTWTGHEHFVIAERDGGWDMGYAERGGVAPRGRYASPDEARHAVLRELWASYQSAANPEHWKGGLAAGTPFVVEFRYARLFRFFSLFGVVVLWSMAAIGWMAYRVEGADFGRPAMAALLFLGLAWLVALALAPQRVRLEPDALTIRRWTGTRTIPYDAIASVGRSYPFITLHTTAGRLRLFRLYANDDARLLDFLEGWVPAARRRREERLASGFPITRTLFGEKTVTLVITSVLSLAMIGAGILTIRFSLTEPPESGVVVPLLMALGFLAVGLFFLYLLLWNWPWRTVFTRELMIQRFLLRTTRRSMRGIVAFQPGFEMRRVRGAQRKLHHIDVVYENGDTFRWIPGDAYFPMDYIDAAEEARVREFAERLRRAYLA